jgi:hypothetical protein
MGEFMDKDTGKEAEGHNRADNVGNEPGSDEGGIDRDGEYRDYRFDVIGDFAPDNPGKEGDNQDKRVVDQDWNPENAADTIRPVHNKGLSF